MQNPRPTVPRLARFAAWMIAVAAALAGQWIPRAGRWISLGSLAVMLILLITTPREAIRLPRWVSEILILSASVAMQLHRNRLNHWWMLIATVMLLFAMRFANQSAWWAALFAWLPI